jgi:uncharacterized protein (DUF433 family)
MKTDLLERITINSEICHGKPTIRGLRYPVENILELLASGMTIDEILKDYPDLYSEDILACIKFAAETMFRKSASIAYPCKVINKTSKAKKVPKPQK